MDHIRSQLMSKHHQMESSKRKKEHFRKKVDKAAESCSILVRLFSNNLMLYSWPSKLMSDFFGIEDKFL